MRLVRGQSSQGDKNGFYQNNKNDKIEVLNWLLVTRDPSEDSDHHCRGWR
jgi:hypothetical protein